MLDRAWASAQPAIHPARTAPLRKRPPLPKSMAQPVQLQGCPRPGTSGSSRTCRAEQARSRSSALGRGRAAAAQPLRAGDDPLELFSLTRRLERAHAPHELEVLRRLLAKRVCSRAAPQLHTLCSRPLESRQDGGRLGALGPVGRVDVEQHAPSAHRACDARQERDEREEREREEREQSALPPTQHRALLTCK
eukprot:scaffold96072_cov30-Tisochrysis_lutea.AAC.1